MDATTATRRVRHVTLFASRVRYYEAFRRPGQKTLCEKEGFSILYTPKLVRRQAVTGRT